MKIKDEIDKFSLESDKAILHWLFDRYHLETQWNFVAKVELKRYGVYSYQVNRIWSPTEEGLAIHNYMNNCAGS